ncbi:MAG TPA: flagellar biosynthetic protein FliO [Verrucomicrobiae bacterium]|nr:flagellar biosynthetic protein FliO [Verrucomicrobiae bacterium]
MSFSGTHSSSLAEVVAARQRLGVRRFAPLLEPNDWRPAEDLLHSTLVRPQKRRQAAHSKTFGIRACRPFGLRVGIASGFAILLPVLCGFSAPSTNLFSSPLAPGLPDTGPSLLRVLGALALVLGLFLGGVWFVRHGRFSTLGRGRLAKLHVLETRSLGARQAICVVAYGSERFLVGSTPAGINLISHLTPDAAAENVAPGLASANLSFGQALAQVLRGGKPVPAKPSNS